MPNARPPRHCYFKGRIFENQKKKKKKKSDQLLFHVESIHEI